MIYRSFSSKETERLGFALGNFLRSRKPGPRALVVALRGDLGSGKTTFTRGLIRGLGSRAKVISPTFVIMRRMPLPKGSFRNAVHIDAYRMQSAKHARAAGFDSVFKTGENIIIVEWPERARGAMPKSALRILFRHGTGASERAIDIPRRFIHALKRRRHSH